MPTEVSACVTIGSSSVAVGDIVLMFGVCQQRCVFRVGYINKAARRRDSSEGSVITRTF